MRLAIEFLVNRGLPEAEVRTEVDDPDLPGQQLGRVGGGGPMGQGKEGDLGTAIGHRFHVRFHERQFAALKLGEPGKNLVDAFPGVGPGSCSSDLSTRMGQKKPDELHTGIAARAENGYLGRFHGYRFWMAGKSRLANAE